MRHPKAVWLRLPKHFGNEWAEKVINVNSIAPGYMADRDEYGTFGSEKVREKKQSQTASLQSVGEQRKI